MSYFHVGFKFSQPLSNEKHVVIAKALNTVCADWLYYDDHCWIVFSYFTADRIHIMLREAIDRADCFLILPIDMGSARQGFVPQWIWDWLSIDRSSPNWQQKRDALVATLSPPPPPPQNPELDNYIRAMLALEKPPKTDG